MHQLPIWWEIICGTSLKVILKATEIKRHWQWNLIYQQCGLAWLYYVYNICITDDSWPAMSSIQTFHLSYYNWYNLTGHPMMVMFCWFAPALSLSLLTARFKCTLIPGITDPLTSFLLMPCPPGCVDLADDLWCGLKISAAYLRVIEDLISVWCGI